MKIGVNDAAVRFTGRWEIGKVGAITTAPGSMFEIAFTGKAAVLHFDMTMNMHPYPHIWISVDDGAKIEAPLSHVLRVEATGEGNHVVRVIYKSAVEIQHRWYQPLIGKVCFCGFEADGEGELPQDNRKIIEFIGDSITEGVLIDAMYEFEQFQQNNRPNQDDSTATYAYLTAMELGMKPVVMGYELWALPEPAVVVCRKLQKPIRITFTATLRKRITRRLLSLTTALMIRENLLSCICRNTGIY